MPNTIFANIFLFVVISMAISANISLIWMIFYLLFKRNILVGFHLLYASFIGGNLGSISGGIIGLVVLKVSYRTGFDWMSDDIHGLFFAFIAWILGIFTGSFWAAYIILKDYQR